MMPNVPETMTDEQWQTLIRDTARSFDDLTIKRGFQYYKQGRVGQLTHADTRELRALVQGTEPYRVVVNLDNLTKSRCECPVNGACKHMAAVLLQYADDEGRSVPMLVNAKSAALVSAKPKKGAEGGLAHRAQIELTAQRLPELSIREWREWMALILEPFNSGTRNARYVEEALAAIRRVNRKLPEELEPLFDLHAHVVILESMLAPSPYEQSVYMQETFIGYNTHLAIEALQSGIAAIMGRGLRADSNSPHWRFVAETLTQLRGGLLVKSPMQPHYVDLYKKLWRYWIQPRHGRDHSLYEQELEALRAAKAELGDRTDLLYSRIAQCWMHYYRGDDRAVWALLADLPDSPRLPREVLALLEPLARDQAWQRLADWLGAVAPAFRSYRRDSLEAYAAQWDTLLTYLPEAEPLMWKSYVQLLPYSASLYEERLHAHGRWQEWIDYQLTNGSEPLDFRVNMLQPIEKAAPELLLPFYHQAVERYILQKNRDSYKAAVKLLKRLAKLYTKLKQQDRWAHFLERFTERHSRLRALTEELRKGKLIP